MNPARPTIRCLLDELKADLKDANQRSALSSGNLADLGSIPLSQIEHPLIAKANRLLSMSADELMALKISAVRDRLWYRVKIEQFRGAAHIDANGVLWLCAAGFRRDGDRDDFYKSFERLCVNGSEIFLPTESDQKRLRLELLLEFEQRRLASLRERVIEAVVTAFRDRRTVAVELPTDLDESRQEFRSTAMLQVDISDNGPDYPNDLTISIEIINYTGPKFEDVLLEVQDAMPGISRSDWDVVPDMNSSQVPSWWVVVPERWIEAVCADYVIRGAPAMAVDPPDLTDGSGVWCHIVMKEGLTEAVVVGCTVRALCGRTFHPVRDPDGRDACPACVAAHARIQEIEAARRMARFGTEAP